MSTPTTVISTFDGDAYFIVGRTPEQVQSAIKGNQFMRLPSGTYVATSSIKAMSTYEDYRTTHEVADHHKRREWLGKDGYWHSPDGSLLEKVDTSRFIQRVTDTTALPSNTKKHVR